jgi:hypothetical protein
MIQEATAEQQKRPFSIWNPDMCGDLFEQRGRNAAPPKEVASRLVAGEYALVLVWADQQVWT